MCVYRYSIDQSRLGLPVLKILLDTNAITVPVPKSLNVRLSCFVTLRLTALSYWQQFPAARVLLPHAELRHLSTSSPLQIRSKTRRCLQPLCAAVLHSAGGLARRIANYPVPRTNPRTLPSHYTHLAPRILPSPCTVTTEYAYVPVARTNNADFFGLRHKCGFC